MVKILAFVAGVFFTFAGGVVLTSCSYAAWQAFTDGQYQQILYPALYGLGALIVFLAGLRVALRIILPGFTFTRLMLAGVAVLVVLHMGGYLSLSSETLQNYADKAQRWMRDLDTKIPDDMKKVPDFKSAIRRDG